MPDVLSCKEENETHRKRKDSKTTGKCNIAAENGELLNGLSAAPDEKPPVTATRDEFGSQLKIIQINDQVRELQTILRDK